MSGKTIAAISSGTGGGVGMVRISGPDALQIADLIFHPMNENKTPSMLKGYTGAYGAVHNKSGKVDDAVLFVYRAPNSYTGEDVIEITCHGGTYVCNQVLAASIEAGAVLATPGEYTKRALLNGKMTLTEAESVVDIIAAENQQSLKAALSAMDGALYKELMSAENDLTDVCAHIAAWIDYPEEDVDEIVTEDLKSKLINVLERLDCLEQSYEQGRLIREGINTAIVGSTNAGKSTLMNQLSGFDKSIVTNIPGTTRDIVEESVRVGDLMLHLQDTAGIRESDDIVEKLGIERSRKAFERCDLILAVFDQSVPINPEQHEWINALKNKTAISILNKSDLPNRIGLEDLDLIQASSSRVITMCAESGYGVSSLIDAIREVVGLSHFNPQAALIANTRQLECIVKAKQLLEEGINALLSGETLDAVSVCLEESADFLLTLSGQRASSEMIDKVFEQFCVGK